MNRQVILKRLWFLAVLGATSTLLAAGPAGFNYDESKVHAYTLPDPLKCADGTMVRNRTEWINKRRSEVLELFRSEVFGRVPAGLPKPAFTIIESDKTALKGAATRKQVAILLAGTNGGPALNLLMYIPNARKSPAPGFVGLNFGGNHTVTTDPAVLMTTQWVGDKYGKGNRATPEMRGYQSSRWPIQKIIEHGFAVVTAYYGDLEPDFPEGWKSGVRGVFGSGKEFASDDWGAIACWAWGLSRVMDYVETDSDIDSRHFAVIGHSRLGKTALWAGASDERFAAVISNDSGEGGAALARRNFGETTARINTNFPHWFCGNYKKYMNNESALPVDAHMLIGLCAPRPVYVASAQEDLWADPKGEFLALKASEPVYKLFGVRGVGSREMPPVNKAVIGHMGYHIRSGVHDIRDFDWDQYLKFAEMNFRK